MEVTQRTFLKLLLLTVSFVEGHITSNGASIVPNIQYRQRRSARRMKEYLWIEKNVPYIISSDLRKHSKLIHSAMKEFDKTTCLTFVMKETWHNYYVAFEAGDICSSNIGRSYWSNSGQNITLGKHCLHKEVIIHELMHTLGFWHEHSRPDRHKYIEIMWENITPGNEESFERNDDFITDGLGLNYDFHSILHYNNYAFTANTKPTIKALSKVDLRLGNSKGLSPGDIRKINKLYDCREIRKNHRPYVSAWTDWSPCIDDCLKYRQRVCFGGEKKLCKGMNKYGVQTEVMSCSDAECYAPVDGHWGKWSTWSGCFSRRIRTRECDNPEPKFNGKYCFGDFLELQNCGRSVIEF